MACSQTWFLLEQEGLLAQACLCNGLTALRRANLGDKKGLFYSAFFELSTGFERTLKLVLILNHMANNQLVPPDSKTIENFGHKLRSLLDEAKAICSRRNLTTLDAFKPDSLPIAIMGFLDDFAHPGGRYSNINKLTGNRLQAMADPIVKWGEIANRILVELGSRRERKNAELVRQIATVAFGNSAISLLTDLDQQPIGVAPLHVRAYELDTASKYAVYALVSLIAAIREVIDTLCRSAMISNPAPLSGKCEVPAMAEFFEFAWPNRAYVLRKRQWP